MGVPEKAMHLGSGRRYERAGLDITKMCTGLGASRVLALLLPDRFYNEAKNSGRMSERAIGGPGSAAEARKVYQKAGIEAVPVFVDL